MIDFIRPEGARVEMLSVEILQLKKARSFTKIQADNCPHIDFLRFRQSPKTSETSDIDLNLSLLHLQAQVVQILKGRDYDLILTCLAPPTLTTGPARK